MDVHCISELGGIILGGSIFPQRSEQKLIAKFQSGLNRDKWIPVFLYLK
jgi:hypothetical protein